MTAESDELTALRRQVRAARYAQHKVRIKLYGDAVARGEMSVEEASERYRFSMLNHDGIVANAVTGASEEANEADMVRGFRIE